MVKKKTINKGNLKSGFHNDNVTQSVFLNLLKPKFPLKTKKDLTTKTPRKTYAIILKFSRYCVHNRQKIFCKSLLFSVCIIGKSFWFPDIFSIIWAGWGWGAGQREQWGKNWDNCNWTTIKKEKKCFLFQVTHVSHY